MFAQDAVKAADVDKLYVSLEHLRAIPMATQPPDLVGITLRPYQVCAAHNPRDLGS